MGTVEILNYSSSYPVTSIGYNIRLCRGEDVSNENINLTCGYKYLNSGHIELLKSIQLDIAFHDWPMYAIQEWRRYSTGVIMQFQSAEQYRDKNIDYMIPESVKSADQEEIYRSCVNKISWTISQLISHNVPVEDALSLLPMCTKVTIVNNLTIVDLIDIGKHTLNDKASSEFKAMFNQVLDSISYISEEWDVLAASIIKPRCN